MALLPSVPAKLALLVVSVVSFVLELYTAVSDVPLVVTTPTTCSRTDWSYCSNTVAIVCGSAIMAGLYLFYNQ